MIRLLARRHVVPAAAAMLLAFASIGVAAPATRAATISLGTCTHSASDVSALWSAIVDANNEATHPGPDTIELAASCRYEIGSDFLGSHYALPPITTAITILGHGATVQVTLLPDTDDDGVGIFDVRSGADLIVADVTLQVLRGWSGGSYVTNAGSVLMTDTTIEGGSRVNFGAAIVNHVGASLSMLDSEVSGVVHFPAAIDNAGDMYVIGTDLVDDNAMTLPDWMTPDSIGAAIRNSGYLEVMDSAIRQTQTFAPNYKWGRGVENSGQLLLRRSTVADQRSINPGAGVHSTGTMDVDASTFASNDAIGTDVAGGAIANSGTATIENSTFAGNFATGGGGAIRNSWLLTIADSTFGGFDEISTVPLLPITVSRSILTGCTGGTVDGGNNLRQQNAGCPGTLGDPKLQYRDRPGLEPDVLALGPGSLAIDAGGSSCPAKDQRGFARPAGGACDIGAYENQPPAKPTAFVLAQGANPSNTGNLGIDWANVIDPDGDPLTYRLEGEDADDVGFAQLYAGSASVATLASLAEGTYGLRVTASDGNATSGYATLSGLVVDRSAPTAPVASTDRNPEYTAGDGTRWWADQVVVSFAGSTDPQLVDGSAPSGVASTTPPQTRNTSGQHIVSGSSADAAGNLSPSSQITVNVDADAPTIAFDTCPTSVILGRSTALTWSATDAESGLAGAATGRVTVDTSTVGSRTLSVTATDQVGHSAGGTCVVAVIYDFKGFLQPTGNPPAFNKASAGSIQTITFSLGGQQGLAIFAAGYPASAPITCGSSAELVAGTATTPVTPALIYAGGRYTYQWKTDKSWAGTCRQFIVRLADGTFHRANFSFK